MQFSKLFKLLLTFSHFIDIEVCITLKKFITKYIYNAKE